MESSTTSPIAEAFRFSGTKRLASRDRVWIVTDVQTFTSALYPWSEPQRWYRAGALDLNSEHLIIAEWSTDDMKAILKAGMQAGVGAPPWSLPQSHGFQLTRFSHGTQEKGRFREKVTLLDLDAALVRRGPALRKSFERSADLQGNMVAGSLHEMVDLVARENAIEAAALSRNGWFAAGDVKRIVGKNINVSRSLALMVEDGILISNGKAKRWAKYMKTPPLVVERSDWMK